MITYPHVIGVPATEMRLTEKRGSDRYDEVIKNTVS